MRYQRILAIGLSTLAASLLAACNTEFGPGDGTDDGSGTAKYPTLDGKRQQSFALTSLDNAPANSRESFAKAFAQNAVFIAVDVVVFGGADSLFLARKFVDSIEWLAFWR